jgi:polysaccharide export outer membrane protein
MTASAGMVAGVAAFVGGCSNFDSYLDPSVLGRWEYTPASVPVLEYISSIEGKPADLVAYSDVMPSDLLPSPADYRVGPGDRIQVRVYDIISRDDIPTQYERQVDIRGTIDVPQLGRLFISGKTIGQIKDLLTERMRGLIADPLVEVDILDLRQQTFTLLGAVSRPGAYFIPKPDFRILEALPFGERYEPAAKEIYVIRLVGLDPALDDPTGGPPPDAIGGPSSAAQPATPSGSPGTRDKQPAAGEDLINIIDDLSKPAGEPRRDRPSPAAVRGGQGLDLNASAVQPAADRRPIIDLPDPTAPAAAIEQPAVGETSAAPWAFVNGKWVQVRGNASSAGTATTSGGEPIGLEGDGRRSSDIITQRVIRIPLERLLAGDSSLNIIIRPGDVIRVPDAPRGEFYIGGLVRRPGVYNLPADGRMTIRRAIDTAGGLDSLAWPERAELIRVVGKNRQAIVSMNLRAIAEATQPDVYIRQDDHINVGTSFWAIPLAVLRNGMRANYGFGLLLDRNFGNDVFGVPPEYNTRSPSLFP